MGDRLSSKLTADIMRQSTAIISLARMLDGLMLAFGILLVLCATAKPAYSYVDPGSGLFLLQIIGTTLAGFIFMIRKRIRQMLSMFGAKAKKLD